MPTAVISMVRCATMIQVVFWKKSLKTTWTPSYPLPKNLSFLNQKSWVILNLLELKNPCYLSILSDFVAANPNDIKPGMEVIHLKFGQGKVKSVDERLVATIIFDGLSDTPEKRIMLQFAKLQIVE
jgi:hypothetical protein